MQKQFCFKPEGPESFKVGIIPGTSNSELRHLGKMAVTLKQSIPFKYEVVSEPSVALDVTEENKQGLPKIELRIRPTQLKSKEAIGALRAKNFVSENEVTYA